MTKISIAVFFLFVTLSVRADLPVHCLKHQVAGDWKMSISEPHLTGPGPVSCGHHIPDD
jgi:cathepsin C